MDVILVLLNGLSYVVQQILFSLDALGRSFDSLDLRFDLVMPNRQVLSDDLVNCGPIFQLLHGQVKYHGVFYVLIEPKI